MSKSHRALAVHDAFPIGAHVTVTGGRYARDEGVVVRREPDLRPGSMWVALRGAGTHLVPAYRLAVPDAA